MTEKDLHKWRHLSENFKCLCSPISSKHRTLWPYVLRHRSAAASLQVLRVRIPLTAWMFVGKSLCNELITYSAVSYSVGVCLILCNLETSTVRRPRADLGLFDTTKILHELTLLSRVHLGVSRRVWNGWHGSCVIFEWSWVVGIDPVCQAAFF